MDFIGAWSAHAATYALVLTTTTFFAFSLPIFLLTGTWARLLRWNIPSDTDLAWYFARCLGSFAIVANVLFFRAALTGNGLVTMLELFVLFSGLMVVVHIWGALEGSQPLTETLEIGLWAVLMVLTLLFLPVAG